MSYLYEPARISGAYRPLIFRNSRTTTADAEYLICNVYVNTGLKATFRKPWFSSGADFLFDVDVQSVVARNMSPYTTQKTTVFGNLGVRELYSSTDAFVEYYIDSSLEVRGTDGYLQTVAGSSEVSSTLYALPAVRPVESLTMSAYYSPSAGGDFKFLTTAPQVQEVGTNESFFVSWLSRGTDAMQLLFYSTAGAQVGSTVILTSTSSADEKMNSISVGPANLTGTGTLVVLNGSLPTNFNNIAYYTFSAGTWSGSAYTRKSEVRQLNITSRCGWSQRVYWMGLLGGCEQYTFQGQIIKKQADTGAVGELALNWNIAQSPPVQAHDLGIVKTGIDGRIEYEITEPIGPDAGDWLRVLRKSPEVYLDVNGKYRAVTVEPGNATYERSREAEAEFQCTLIVDQETAQEL